MDFLQFGACITLASKYGKNLVAKENGMVLFTSAFKQNEDQFTIIRAHAPQNGVGQRVSSYDRIVLQTFYGSFLCTDSTGKIAVCNDIDASAIFTIVQGPIQADIMTHSSDISIFSEEHRYFLSSSEDGDALFSTNTEGSKFVLKTIEQPLDNSNVLKSIATSDSDPFSVLRTILELGEVFTGTDIAKLLALFPQQDGLKVLQLGYTGKQSQCIRGSEILYILLHFSTLDDRRVALYHILGCGGTSITGTELGMLLSQFIGDESMDEVRNALLNNVDHLCIRGCELPAILQHYNSDTEKLCVLDIICFLPASYTHVIERDTELVNVLEQFQGLAEKQQALRLITDSNRFKIESKPIVKRRSASWIPTFWKRKSFKL
jgi:hypothetical protein